MFVQIIHLLFIVPILLVAVHYDFKTLYIARSLVRLQIIAVALIIMQVKYKFKAISVLKNTYPMAVSALIMGVAGYLLRQVSPSMIWQFASVFICIILYFAILLGLFPSVRSEVFDSAVGKKIMRKLKR